jgi:hypothetical protein
MAAAGVIAFREDAVPGAQLSGQAHRRLVPSGVTPPPQAHVANQTFNPESVRKHRVGSSLACVRAIQPGVSEPVNSAQKCPPTSGHRP